MTDHEDDGSRAVIEEYLRLAGDPDLDAYMALWADGGRIEMPYHPDPTARVLDGIEMIRARAAFARELMAEMRSYDITIRPLVEPGVFLCEYRGQGRMKTGREYSNRYCCVGEVRDGKVVLWREYFDPTARTLAWGDDEEETT